MKTGQRKRWVLPVCILTVLAVVCFGVYGLMLWFGSPLIPGSLERRITSQVMEHQKELSQLVQTCQESKQIPEELPLGGLVRKMDFWNGTQAVEFFCNGWGLAPSSSYYGFYYSPAGPLGYGGAEVELTPVDGGGYRWEDSGNHGFTKEITEGFYYYEAHF